MLTRLVRYAAGGLVCGAAMSLLAACTPAPAATVFVTAAPVPAETVYVTVAPTPPPGAAAAPPVQDPVPNAPAPVVEEGPAFDTGAVPGASGAPTLDDSGNPVGYKVVAGDYFFDIAQRFDLPQQQLLRMNPSIPNFGETLYIGQFVNLDWTKTV